MPDRLLCGAAKNKISPDLSLIPNLLSLAGLVKFSQIHDDLYVRCIYLENGENKVLLVSFDLDKAPYPLEWTEAISKITDVPADNILYISTHTHTAPIIGYRPNEPLSDITKKPAEMQKAVKAYEAMVREQLIKSVREALRSRRPARTGFGTGECFINCNRVFNYARHNEDGSVFRCLGEGFNGKGPADHNVYVLRFEDLEGKAIAFFINYAVHGVIMFLHDTGNGTSAISGDIGGNTSQGLEAEYPESIVMWSSGAAGDVNPIMKSNMMYPDPKTGELKKECMKSYEDSLFVLDLMTGNHLASIRGIIEKIQCSEENPKIAAAVEWSETPSKDKNRLYKIRLHLIRIGDTGLIGNNGEMYTSYALNMQKASILKNTIIINHDSSLTPDSPGYILDEGTANLCEAADKVDIPGKNFSGIPDAITESLMNKTKSLCEKVMKG
jgi:hypothetical protein